MKEIIILTVILVVLPLDTSGTIYFVDENAGNDSYNGTTIASAFATIKACTDVLASPGDECHVRRGSYHQRKFQISNKTGTADRPIIIRGYDNEIPTINGTILLTPKAGTSGWVLNMTTGIYSAQIDKDIWQLFVGGEMMTNARWPNALWSDKTVFLNSHWAKSARSSTRGRMVDNSIPNLAASGLNATGAMAILNIGSFNTFTAIVKNHTPGQNFFTYDDTFGDINFNPRRIRNQYFLEDKLEFLDVAGEWFYDNTSKTVYVKTPDGASPAGRIHGKVQASMPSCIFFCPYFKFFETNKLQSS